jgi:hypothetical protein
MVPGTANTNPIPVVDRNDVAALTAAFQTNPNDLGVGLYNPQTGEVRLGSFDLVTIGQGHQGLADAVGIKDNSEWRGFIVSPDGRFNPGSHFNIVDGDVMMKPDLAAAVEQALKGVGLVK